MHGCYLPTRFFIDVAVNYLQCHAYWKWCHTCMCRFQRLLLCIFMLSTSMCTCTSQKTVAALCSRAVVYSWTHAGLCPGNLGLPDVPLQQRICCIICLELPHIRLMGIWGKVRGKWKGQQLPGIKPRLHKPGVLGSIPSGCQSFHFVPKFSSCCSY